MLKEFANEAVLDFLRITEWEKCKTVYTLTVDGSLSYDLDTLLSSVSPPADPFLGEIKLFSSDMEYMKKNYENYASMQSTTGYFAMLGNVLYVGGDDGTLMLVYKTTGYPKVMTNDSDENRVAKYYNDILCRMTVIKFLQYLNDESWMVEQKFVEAKILSLKYEENRIRKYGQFHGVYR